MIEIDKNKKMPTNILERHKNAKSRQYPFAEMEVGDSFRVEGKVNKNRVHIAINAVRWAKRNGSEKVFSTVVEGDGYRCFRVK